MSGGEGLARDLALIVFDAPSEMARADLRLRVFGLNCGTIRCFLLRLIAFVPPTS